MTDRHTKIDELPEARVKAACLVRIVDDDETMLNSYRFMLGAVGWQVKCYQQARAFLNDQNDAAGCLVLDVRMPQMSGLELHAEMRRIGVTLPVIFVTGHGDVDMAVQTMKDGAVDFMLKPVVPDRLKEAVLHWCREDCKRRLSELQNNALESDARSLTEREREVAQLVVQGLSNKAIAAKLSIAERTVKFHRASACEKLGVGSTAQLIARMMLLKEKGLV